VVGAVGVLVEPESLLVESLLELVLSEVAVGGLVVVLVALMPVPTFTVAVPAPNGDVPVMIVVPLRTPVMIPSVLTFAMEVSLDVHMARLRMTPEATWPLKSLPVAMNSMVPPTAMEATEGARVTVTAEVKKDAETDSSFAFGATWVMSLPAQAPARSTMAGIANFLAEANT
jgi:hypothetical protein